ncbi:MAG: translation initiation factor IF-2 [candidate division NC10 bacterium]|nr:translation initiation factor IF-2 [candidate division NC10 bacterium]
MAKIRVFELAKAVGRPNAEVLTLLQAGGMDVKSHSSSVDEVAARAILADRKGAKPPTKLAGAGTKAKAEPTTEKAPAETRTPVRAKAKLPAAKAPTRPAPQAAKPAAPAAPPAAKVEAPVKPLGPPILTRGPVPRHAKPAPSQVRPPSSSPVPPPAKPVQPASPPAPPTAAAKPSASPVVKPAAPAAPPAKPPLLGASTLMRPAAPAAPVKPGTPVAPPRPAAPPMAKPAAPATPPRPAPPVTPAPKPAAPPAPARPGVPPVTRPAPPPAARPKPSTPPPPAAPPAAEAAASIPAAPSGPAAPQVIKVAENVTVKELAGKLAKNPSELIKKLIKLGVMATVNQTLTADVIKKLAANFGHDVEVAPPEELEEAAVAEVEDPAQLRPRGPVVTIMGHVDHGKTSLLDAIRHTSVAASEAGGITQHIGAYEVEVGSGRVVFLDTPGHEAFTAMRARGAHVTDIVVLVVAADDGVMPQTVEAINHAKDAGVPILVAVNKIDKPNADPARVRQQLADKGLVPEEWGGDTIYVEISAKKRQGIENLLDHLLVLAEVQELRANPTRPAKGTVVEAELDKGRGPVATVLVQQGTLRVGNPVVAGLHYGRVRALINDKGRKVQEAGPAMPVEVLGLSGVAEAGDALLVVTDERKARQIALARQQKRREQAVVAKPRVTLDDLHKRVQKGELKELRIILKGDVQGSIEPLKESLERLSTPQVKLEVIHTAVGAITESDVMLAAASDAVLVGFSVRPEPKAQKLAEDEQVDVRLHTVIYEAVDQVKKAMEGLLEPQYVERHVGRLEVRNTFNVPKVGTVAGCYVQDGKAMRDATIRLVRDGRVIHEGKVASLRRFKDDVREVSAGYECGVGLLNFGDIKVGDLIEVYELEAVAPKL